MTLMDHTCQMYKTFPSHMEAVWCRSADISGTIPTTFCFGLPLIPFSSGRFDGFGFILDLTLNLDSDTVYSHYQNFLSYHGLYLTKPFTLTPDRRGSFTYPTHPKFGQIPKMGSLPYHGYKHLQIETIDLICFNGFAHSQHEFGLVAATHPPSCSEKLPMAKKGARVECSLIPPSDKPPPPPLRWMMDEGPYSTQAGAYGREVPSPILDWEASPMLMKDDPPTHCIQAALWTYLSPPDAKNLHSSKPESSLRYLRPSDRPPCLTEGPPCPSVADHLLSTGRPWAIDSKLFSGTRPERHLTHLTKHPKQFQRAAGLKLDS